MQYAPTRIHPNPALFYTQTVGDGTFRGVCFCALHVYVQNPPGFIFPHTNTPKTHPILPFPIRVHPKFGGFHIPAHGCAKNAPDFTLPNKDTPKTRSILGANPCRRTFRGVCFCAPTRVHQKPGGFWTQTFGGRHFWGVCNTPLHGYVQNLAGLTFPHTDTPKTHPILPFPIGIHRKPAQF